MRSTEIHEEIEQLRSDGLHRQLRSVCGRQGPRMQIESRDVLMFAGANYLGLAGDRRVIDAARAATDEYGCAAGGARLISGNLELHESLEHALASFLTTEATLLFSTGYMANLGVLTAIAGENDVIVSDDLNHASIIDACRLSRATCRRFAHADVEDFRRVASSLAGFRRRVLVTDGVFSMDGDTAPLGDLVPLAREFDMTIVVDDAHGCGILGPTGRGTPELYGVDVDIHIGNLGKALGSFGAFVGCSAEVRDYLVNRARAFIFTCALPPSAIGAAREALRVLVDEPMRREALLGLAGTLRDGLQNAGFDTGTSSTHIVPAIVGDNEETMRICEAALAQGVYAQGIRFPSVPHGTARLRLTPMADHTNADVAAVVDVLQSLRQP